MKAFLPTDLSFVDLIVMFFNFLSDLNTFFPIFFTFLPRVTFVNCLQFSIAELPIVCTLFPTIMVFACTPFKDFSDMAVTLYFLFLIFTVAGMEILLAFLFFTPVNVTSEEFFTVYL